MSAEPVQTSARLLRWLGLGAGVVAAAAAVTWFALGGAGTVTTDNAYLKADKLSLATDVGGIIDRVHVRPNQQVERGQLLISLDDTPFRIAVSEAEAHVGQVMNELQARRSEYAEAEAALEQARRDADYYRRQLARNENMGPLGVSEAQLDEARQALARARSEISISRERLSSLAAELGGDITGPLEQQADLRVAQAQLEKARYQLSRTRIRAPVEGVVANEVPQAGEMVPAGFTLITLLSSEDTWVEANLKETQLAGVRPGQRARVQVDAYPGIEWEAVVESVSRASGSELALIPAQNASGNWVKVVQRVPVRLRLLEEARPQTPLLAGMSVRVSIDTAAPPPAAPTADDTAQLVIGG